VQVIATSFIPPLFDAVLADYKRCIPDAREAEVLALMTALTNKLKTLIAPHVPSILEAVFECTLSMITANFTTYPDVRLNFFKMIQALNEHCFAALFSIAPSHQKFVVHSIVWAFRHQERNICETGLDILQQLLNNVAAVPGAGQQQFYQQYVAQDPMVVQVLCPVATHCVYRLCRYFVSLLQDVLWVLTDRLHKFAFKQHAQILHHMFRLVATNAITAPLFPAGTPGKTNQVCLVALPSHEGMACDDSCCVVQIFVGEHVCKLLLSYFKNLNNAQVTAFVQGLFDMSKDQSAYKTHMRDFLIELREFKSEDNRDLYAEETAIASKRQAEEERARMLAVPGLIAGAHDAMDDI